MSVVTDMSTVTGARQRFRRPQAFRMFASVKSLVMLQKDAPTASFQNGQDHTEREDNAKENQNVIHVAEILRSGPYFNLAVPGIAGQPPTAPLGGGFIPTRGRELPSVSMTRMPTCSS